MTTPLPDPPGLRISDADRERAAQRLQLALTEGRITVAELDERLAVVYAARYEAELVPPLADLPSGIVTAPAIPSTPTGPSTVLRAGLSGIRRTGVWSVPARLRVQSVVGSVLLDFCRAENLHPVVEIELMVHVDGRPDWPVTHQESMAPFVFNALKPGKELVCFVNPEDPTEMVLNL